MVSQLLLVPYCSEAGRIRKMKDLFEQKIPKDRLHPNYEALSTSPVHDQVRVLMNHVYNHMGDPNGNFRKDFQGNGFHARVFELSLFSYLDAAGFDVDHTYEQPDFLASRDGTTICLEATTANPPDGRERDVSILRLEAVVNGELYEKVYREFPRRILMSLSKKVQHRYHLLEQCVGNPLVVAVGAYFEPGSMMYTDEALVSCLYGLGETHGPPLRDTPFFLQPQNRSISAVLFTNQFTVPRFFRLGTTLPHEGVETVVRTGVFYQDINGPMHSIGKYEYRLGNPCAPVETWQQGVTLFLNPEADVPMAADGLPCTCAFEVQDGYLKRIITGFHTATSFMTISVSDG
ncbi:MAG: hypothetical protein ACYDEV_00385 [Acidiferrobacter sp.]